jgi:hypothetical protein
MADGVVTLSVPPRLGAAYVVATSRPLVDPRAAAHAAVLRQASLRPIVERMLDAGLLTVRLRRRRSSARCRYGF